MTRTEVIEAARQLVPVLRERAPKQAQTPCILAETMDDLRDAGVFRALQPTRWGGLELDLGAFGDIQIALAEGDASVGWVYGILSTHAFHLGLFDDDAARDVWDKDSAALVSSPYAPSGKTQAVEGGYSFSGRWPFASGSQHCSWALLGGMIDGVPHVFLLARDQYEIVENWNVIGLTGTGSHDIVVADAFVPGYRVGNMKGPHPGREVNTGPLYRISLYQVFFRGVTTAAIGALQAMCDAFVEYGSVKVTSRGSRTADSPDARLAIAAATSQLDEMRTTMHRNFARLHEYAEAGVEAPVAERQLYKYECTQVPDRCLSLAADLFKATGGAGIYDELPFGRIYRDLITMRQHVGAQSSNYGRNVGGALLGMESPDLDV